MSICPCAKSCLGSAYWPFNCSIMKRSPRINLALLVGYGWIRVLACGEKNKKKTNLHIFLWGSEGRHVTKLNFYLPTCRDTPLAYHRTTNTQVHYYPPLSSTSSSQSRMYLIILLSVTLWRLFGGCYLFAVETPQGSTADKRLLFCKQPSDLRLGLAPFQMGLFCIGLKLKSSHDRFPRGKFNGITVRSTPRRVVTLELSGPEGVGGGGGGRGNVCGFKRAKNEWE